MKWKLTAKWELVKSMLKIFPVFLALIIVAACPNPMDDLDGGSPPPIFTVSYDGNGNSGGTVPTDANNYEEGQSFTVFGNTQSLAKIGHTFAGWNTQADCCRTTCTQGETCVMEGADVTLYAEWTINLYTLTYDGNGSTSGSVPTGPASYDYGQQVTVLENTDSLVKMQDGISLLFTGWNTAADGSETDHAAAATFNIGSDAVSL